MGPSGETTITGFLHRDPAPSRAYTRVHTTSGSMSLAGEHFLVRNGKFDLADEVTEGDIVNTHTGQFPVTRVESITSDGAYHIFVKCVKNAVEDCTYYAGDRPHLNSAIEASHLMVLGGGWDVDSFKWIARKMKECYSKGYPLNFTPEFGRLGSKDDTKVSVFECGAEAVRPAAISLAAHIAAEGKA